jgi:DNA-binding protein H-NS
MDAGADLMNHQIFLKEKMATLSQIEQRIVQLQKKADDLRRKKSASIILSIRKMMAEHGLTIKDIEAAPQEMPRRRGRPVGSKNTVVAPVVKSAKSAKNTKTPPVAKYRDPVTGATWSGRARPPAWIKDAKDRSKFLIEPPAAKTVSVARKRKGA